MVYLHYSPIDEAMIDSEAARLEFEVFFWAADEPYEKKSLPYKESFLKTHTFVINQLPKDIKLMSGTVAPWFGAPGGGVKYFFIKNNEKVPLSSLIEQNIITYQ